MFRAVSNSCSGRRTSSSAMSRKYIARKLAGSSSAFRLALAPAATGSSASSSSSSSSSSSPAASAVTPLTSSVSSVSIATSGVAPSSTSGSSSSRTGTPDGSPKASGSRAVSLAGTGARPVENALTAVCLTLLSRDGRPATAGRFRLVSPPRAFFASFTFAPRAPIVHVSVEPRRNPDTSGPFRDIRPGLEKYSGPRRDVTRTLRCLRRRFGCNLAMPGTWGPVTRAQWRRHCFSARRPRSVSGFAVDGLFGQNQQVTGSAAEEVSARRKMA